MSKQTNKAHKLASAPQHVRILSGCWRGTKLPVLLQDDIRPTPNRVRETLFNWLQAQIVGSHCLDLFAGSGALGFEAVSRGASKAILVDFDQQVTRLLTQQVEKLQAKQIEIVCDDAMHYLNNIEQEFDIIFLDPPFSKFNPLEILALIKDNQLLKPEGLVYVELSANNFSKNLPPGWQWKRQSKAGEVQYGLLMSR